jgi:hypothetical protein
MHKRWLIWVRNVALTMCVAVPLSAVAQGTSTPEERAQWVEVTRKLETAPLDDSVNQHGEGGWPGL